MNGATVRSDNGVNRLLLSRRRVVCVGEAEELNVLTCDGLT